MIENQRHGWLLFSLLTAACAALHAGGTETVPIIYTTDLYQPHVDPDDHYDLATLYAIKEFNILGIVLDDGKKQRENPGRVPISQMHRLTGRKIPYAIGLQGPLKSPTDKATDQPAELQGGVQLLLDALKASRQKVTIFTAGSLRDVAVAYNRDPELLKKKVSRLYINIGDARPDKQEFNVGLEPNAYICLLRSGLPIYWCPCFGSPLGTYWQFRQGDVLDNAPPTLQNFFIYALTTGRWWNQTPPAGTDDPISFLFGTVASPVRHRIWKAPRNMWCTAPFFHAAGREVVELEPGRWAALPAKNLDRQPVRLYDFTTGRLTIDDNAATSFIEMQDAAQANAHAFKVLDTTRYQEIMTSCLRELFREMSMPQK